MESISRLRHAIIAALRGGGGRNNNNNVHAEQELFDELAVCKARLLNVLDVGPRSPKERQEIESGKTTINGKKMAINADFATQVLFLSAFLECSEHYVAGLLQRVRRENPNIGPEETLEAVVEDFHQTRRYEAECLQFLFEAAASATTTTTNAEGDDVGIYARIKVYVDEELVGSAGGGNGSEPSLAAKILKEINAIDALLVSTLNARQNARSSTTVTDQQGKALGYDILSARLSSLKAERRTLALALCSLPRSSHLSPTDIQLLLDWLSLNPHHPLTYFILVAFFAALDPVDPSSQGGAARRALAANKGLVGYMTKKLSVADAGWKDQGLKAICLLKWTLFCTESRRGDPSLEHRDGFRTEELETQIWNAVQAGGFEFLIIAILHLQGKRTGCNSAMEFGGGMWVLGPELETMRELPPPFFKGTILDSFEVLIRSLITHASSELRKIKQRQEDLVLASTRPPRGGGSTKPHPSSSTTTPSSHTSTSTAAGNPRNDIATLYTLIGLLYSCLPPERALQFWGSLPHSPPSQHTFLELTEIHSGKLPAFLQWAVWSTQPPSSSPHHAGAGMSSGSGVGAHTGMGGVGVHGHGHAQQGGEEMGMAMWRALWDMLGGLARGRGCAELCYNFLARGDGEVVQGSGMVMPGQGHIQAHGGGGGGGSGGGTGSLSWGMMFGMLEGWAGQGQGGQGGSTRQVQQHQQYQHQQQGQSGWGFNAHAPAQQQTQQQAPPQILITPPYVLLAQSTLRLLSTVITHSPTVRIALSSNSHLRAIPTLVSLLPLGVPLELKGALFETLSAFCEPGAGSAGVEICKAVWVLMERLEVINVRGSSASGASSVGGSIGAMGMGGMSGGRPVKGVEIELEDVESVHRLYPSTIPFLHLLSTLLHTPKRTPLKDLILITDGAASLNTIPEALGVPYRLPGVGPYVAFVIDGVFGRIGGREYRRPGERWRVNELCLGVMERAVGGFDLEGLVERVESSSSASASSGGGGGLKDEEFRALLVHPGYDVMKRILGGGNTTLQSTLLSYIVDGIEGFEKDSPVADEPAFISTIVRTLRIILRVLEIQDIYLEVLLPLVKEWNGSREVLGDAVVGLPRSAYTKLDEALGFGPRYIPAIATYVMLGDTCPEVGLLAVKIMTILATATGKNLTALVEQSEDSERILAGFRRILECADGEEGGLGDVGESEALVERMIGAGAPDVLGCGAEEAFGGEEDVEAKMKLVMKAAVLDFFIKCTSQNSGGGGGRGVYPNVGHYLLFGSADPKGIQDPHALGAKKTCLHVVLELVNRGVPRLKGGMQQRGERGGQDPYQQHQGRQHSRQGDDATTTTQESPLFETLPELADKCYRLIYQLCVHPRTSDFTMRYLRTREDFFARQLAVIPAQVPVAYYPGDNNSDGSAEISFIEVEYNDGSRMTSTVPALTAFLRFRAWIFDLAALELHVLTSKGLHKGVTQLLEILFGHEGADCYADEDGMGAGGVGGGVGDEWDTVAFREVGQSHLRIIEFIQSLRFEWTDALALDHVELQLLGQLNLLSCVRTDARGCEVVDRNAVISLLNSAKRTLHAQGNVPTPAHLDQLNSEMAYILQSCAVENHRREIGHAVGIGYESWRRMLDMALMKCFDRLPHAQRENMLFDLLHVLPECICSSEATDIQQSTAVLLAEAVLSCVTKLREDRHYQVAMQSVGGGGDADAGALPAERLHAILRSVLECILEKNRIELVRGNLYATLISYLHLITSTDGGARTAAVDNNINLGNSVSFSRSTSGLDFGDRSLGSSVISSSTTHHHLGQSSNASLVSGSLVLIKSVVERLVMTIARDAIDGAEVWKTIAFMLLDALVQLSRTEKQHVVLASLVRHGILANFVRDLKESDKRLQGVLKPDPDDLNPLYVYEARMSLLIRIAQTRAGAERLLEAQVLSILSQCDFLDARPEADQSFIDNDSFLPPAIQRYHQLLMPALQLVTAIQATLGHKHATAAQQVVEFLASHRDTFAIFLKTETDYTSLSLIEEVHLLVSLCGSVLAYIPKTELATSNSDFGSIHAAILAASARYLGSGQWSQQVEPRTDVEMQDANIPASGYSSMSRFEAQTRRKERLLHKAFVSYIGNASEFTEPEITPVLSPNTNTVRPSDDRGSSRYLATLPSVGDAIEALNSIYVDLSTMMKQISHLSAELSSKEHVRVDDLEEMMSGADLELLQDLDIGQKQALRCRELGRMRGEIIGDAKVLLVTLETLFLLLWRHLTYYADPPSALVPSSTSSSSNGLAMSRFKSSMISALSSVRDREYQHQQQNQQGDSEQGVPDFKSEVGRKLGPVLGRMAGGDIDYEQLGGDWRGSQAYIEIMCRRLRDCAELHAAGGVGGGDVMGDDEDDAMS